MEENGPEADSDVTGWFIFFIRCQNRKAGYKRRVQKQTYSHRGDSLFLTKVLKHRNQKEIFSVDSVGITGWLYRKINLDLFFILYPLICLSRIINLNAKTKITRLLEKKKKKWRLFSLWSDKNLLEPRKHKT